MLHGHVQKDVTPAPHGLFADANLASLLGGAGLHGRPQSFDEWAAALRVSFAKQLWGGQEEEIWKAPVP